MNENVSLQQLPAGTLRGLTSWKNQNYGGPCPPIGRHRYFHHLYALDTTLADLNAPTTDQLRAAMKNHIIAETVLMGTYQKKK
jgi:Raf kinase inhibitor-like YbhB/YbcL family protein